MGPLPCRDLSLLHTGTVRDFIGWKMLSALNISIHTYNGLFVMKSLPFYCGARNIFDNTYLKGGNCYNESSYLESELQSRTV